MSVLVRWLIIVFSISKLRRIRGAVWDNYFSSCRRIAFPKSKRVTLGILANGKITHLRHRRFCHADFATQLGNLIREPIDGIYADIVDDWFLRMVTPL